MSTCKICGGDHVATTSPITGEPRLEKCVSHLAAKVIILEADLSRRMVTESIVAAAKSFGVLPSAAQAPAPPEAEAAAKVAAGEPYAPALEPSPVTLEPAVEPAQEG